MQKVTFFYLICMVCQLKSFSLRAAEPTETHIQEPQPEILRLQPNRQFTFDLGVCPQKTEELQATVSDEPAQAQTMVQEDSGDSQANTLPCDNAEQPSEPVSDASIEIQTVAQEGNEETTSQDIEEPVADAWQSDLGEPAQAQTMVQEDSGDSQANTLPCDNAEQPSESVSDTSIEIQTVAQEGSIETTSQDIEEPVADAWQSDLGKSAQEQTMGQEDSGDSQVNTLPCDNAEQPSESVSDTSIEIQTMAQEGSIEIVMEKPSSSLEKTENITPKNLEKENCKEKSGSNHGLFADIAIGVGTVLVVVLSALFGS